MSRRALLLTLAMGVTACSADRSITSAPSLALGAPTVIVDPALSDALNTAAPTQQFEVIVNFDPALSTAGVLSDAVQALGAGVIRFKHLSMLAALATPGQISTVLSLPGVQSVYLNKPLRFLLAESIAAIRADAVQAAGVTGEGMGIAILDSGVDGLFSPDVAYPDRTVANVKFIADSRDLYEFDEETPALAASLFVEHLANSETSVGHGTHVAGIAGGNGAASGGHYTGVAPGANLIGVGTGDILFVFWALGGFDHILDHQDEYNIQVINNSWGSSGPFDPNDPINEASREAHDRGITVVFAAGNEGPGENTLNPYSVAPWVIGVAAGCKLVENDPTLSAMHCADQTGQGRDSVLADFSSRGIPGDPVYHPTLTAPGVHIVSVRASTGAVLTGADAPHDFDLTSTCAISQNHAVYYTCASGTSMAAPHVTGVVALMEEAAGGALTPDRVKEILLRTARPLDGFAAFEVGAGYLDAWAAVKAAKRGP